MDNKKLRAAAEIRADWQTVNDEIYILQERLQFLLKADEVNAIDKALGLNAKNVKHEITGLQGVVDELIAKKQNLEKEMAEVRETARKEIERKMQDRIGAAGKKMKDLLPELERAAHELVALADEGRAIEAKLESDLRELADQGIRVARPKASRQVLPQWRFVLAGFLAARLVSGHVRPGTNPVGFSAKLDWGRNPQ